MEENSFHQPENQFPLIRISSVFKNCFSLISVTVSDIGNKPSKQTVSTEKNPFPTAGMKDPFKNTFLLDGKKRSLAGVSEKYIKDWFVQARKSASSTRDEAFVEKYVSTMRIICFFWQENLKKIVSTCRKMSFSLKLGPSHFKEQKISSEQKYTVSSRQKIGFHQPE